MQAFDKPAHAVMDSCVAYNPDRYLVAAQNSHIREPERTEVHIVGLEVDIGEQMSSSICSKQDPPKQSSSHIVNKISIKLLLGLVLG